MGDGTCLLISNSVVRLVPRDIPPTMLFSNVLATRKRGYGAGGTPSGLDVYIVSRNRRTIVDCTSPLMNHLLECDELVNNKFQQVRAIDCLKHRAV